MGEIYGPAPTVSKDQFDTEMARVWAIVDRQTDALTHVVWALTWLTILAVVALVVAIVA